MDDYRCTPPTVMGDSNNGSMRCGSVPPSRHERLLVRTSDRRGQVWEWLSEVWREPTPPSV
jgi:hypothetical protein